MESQKENIQRVEALERRVAGVVEKHGAHVCLSSISLNDGEELMNGVYDRLTRYPSYLWSGMIR